MTICLDFQNMLIVVLFKQYLFEKLIYESYRSISNRNIASFCLILSKFTYFVNFQNSLIIELSNSICSENSNMKAIETLLIQIFLRLA